VENKLGKSFRVSNSLLTLTKEDIFQEILLGNNQSMFLVLKNDQNYKICSEKNPENNAEENWLLYTSVHNFCSIENTDADDNSQIYSNCQNVDNMKPVPGLGT